MADDGPLAGRPESRPTTQGSRAAGSAAASSDTPWLLAIECATRSASVALLQSGTLVIEETSEGRGNHAETLLGLVDAVLGRAGVSLASIGRFAVSVGPGSFTSLRVGLATVKGLAFASEVRVAPVSTLAALAWEAGGAEGADVAAALDARRGEVYGGVFRCVPGAEPTAEALCAEGVFAPEAFAALLPERCLAAGSGADLHAEVLAATPGGAVDLRSGLGPSARAVGELGAVLLARGEGVSAADLAPRYLRRAEAEELRLGSAVDPAG